jgi:hypothetical protein
MRKEIAWSVADGAKSRGWPRLAKGSSKLYQVLEIHISASPTISLSNRPLVGQSYHTLVIAYRHF